MLSLTTTTKIHVYTPAVDMRKGVNGLSGIIRDAQGADPTDGSLFVFINRRRDRMKILHFDGGGFWLYYRVLEAGTFEELQGRTSSLISPRRYAIGDAAFRCLADCVGSPAKRYSPGHAEQAA